MTAPDPTIRCILAEQAGDVRPLYLTAAAALAIAAPAVAIAAGHDPNLVAGANAVWTAAHEAAGPQTLNGQIAGVLITQTLIFVILALLGCVPPVRRLLQRILLTRPRCDAEASRLFAAMPEGAVLIYAARAERQVRLLADDSHATRLASVQAQIVSDLALALARGEADDGFLEATARLRAALDVPEAGAALSPVIRI